MELLTLSPRKSPDILQRNSFLQLVSMSSFFLSLCTARDHRWGQESLHQQLSLYHHRPPRPVCHRLHEEKKSLKLSVWLLLPSSRRHQSMKSRSTTASFQMLKQTNKQHLDGFHLRLAPVSYTGRRLTHPECYMRAVFKFTHVLLFTWIHRKSTMTINALWCRQQLRHFHKSNFVGWMQKIPWGGNNRKKASGFISVKGTQSSNCLTDASSLQHTSTKTHNIPGI